MSRSSLLRLLGDYHDSSHEFGMTVLIRDKRLEGENRHMDLHSHNRDLGVEASIWGSTACAVTSIHSHSEWTSSYFENVRLQSVA